MTFRGGDGLAITAAKEQFSNRYVGLLCADVAVQYIETPGGQDFFAIDAAIKIQEASVEIQIKSTNSSKELSKDEIFWSPKQSWIDKWNRNPNRVYLIYVHILKSDTESWLSIEDDNVRINAVGYWTEYSYQADTTRITFPKSNILSSDVIQDWLHDTKKSGYGA